MNNYCTGVPVMAGHMSWPIVTMQLQWLNDDEQLMNNIHIRISSLYKSSSNTMVTIYYISK